MTESDTSFIRLLNGCEKFGLPIKASQDDLPELEKYCSVLENTISCDMLDTYTLLDGDTPIADFGHAEGIGYALQNTAERILALAETGIKVSEKISELKASAKQGEAS